MTKHKGGTHWKSGLLTHGSGTIVDNNHWMMEELSKYKYFLNSFELMTLERFEAAPKHTIDASNVLKTMLENMQLKRQIARRENGYTANYAASSA